MQPLSFSELITFAKEGCQPEGKQIKIVGGPFTSNDIRLLEFLHANATESSASLEKLKMKYWPYATHSRFKTILKQTSLHLCSMSVMVYVENEWKSLSLNSIIRCD